MCKHPYFLFMGRVHSYSPTWELKIGVGLLIICVIIGFFLFRNM